MISCHLVVIVQHDPGEIWWFKDLPSLKADRPCTSRYRADQVLAISDFEQSPSDGFGELGAEVWCVSRECLMNA